MGKLYVTVTMDWEARTINDANISAIQAFRNTFPKIPVTHFLCPAYFSRVSTALDTLLLSRKISSVITSSIDEVALHIHCWYSLMDMAIHRHYETPTWNKNDDPGGGVPYIPDKGYLDFGHDVPLGCYTEAEITRTLLTGRQLIVDSPLKKTGAITSFRCGGWMSADKVLRAVQASGFQVEASAAPGRYFLKVMAPIRPGVALHLWLPLLWDLQVALPTYLANAVRQAVYPAGITGLYPDDVTTPISQPAQMIGLRQIPDTAALADYVSLNTLQTHILAAMEFSKTSNVFISLGWHDTTANRANIFDNTKTNIQVIADAINTIPNGQATFLTVRDAAAVQERLAAGLEPPPFVSDVDTQAVLQYMPPIGPPILET